MTHYICQTCGGELVRGEDGSWICQYCKNSYLDEQANANAELLKELFDEFKLEQIANLRRNLYDAINAQYTDSAEVRRVCGEIKKLLPDDFMANFYEIANGKDLKRTADLINNINVDAYGEYVEGVLKFMIKSFADVFHLPLVNLVERAYSKTDKEKFEKYHTLIQEEAQKENDGVYQTALSRDVFVAYSSADMDKVYSLVSVLEESGISCFVAARNLRHGRGAVQNYNGAICEAINNCTCVIFVSTPSSRNFSCDAVRFELPYIKQTDITNAPAQYRHNYATLPAEYKKPRIEYRISESSSPTAGDRFVKDIFSGFEYAYSEAEVVERLMGVLTGAPMTAPIVREEPKEPKIIEIPKVVTPPKAAEIPKQPAPPKSPSVTVPPARLTTEDETPKSDFSSGKIIGIIVAVLALFAVGGVISSLLSTSGEEEHTERVHEVVITTENFDEEFIPTTEYPEVEEEEKDFDFELLEDGTYRLTDVWNIGSNKVVIVPNEYEGKPVTEIGEAAFIYADIVQVVIPDSITSIGNSAFSECFSLTIINIPNSVAHIGGYAFYGCSSLTSITIPNSVTSIGKDTFSGCTSLTSITFNGTKAEWNEAVKDGVKIPSHTTVTITNKTEYELLEDVFNFTLLNDGTYSVGVNSMEVCPENVVFPSLYNDKAVTVIAKNALKGDYSNENTVVKTVIIPDSVTSIDGYAFRYCTSLTSITIPNSVTNIESSALFGCTSLQSIIFDGSKAEWDKIDKAASGISSSSPVTYTKTVENKTFYFTLLDDGTYSVAIKSNKDCPKNIVIPEAYNEIKVTSIGEKAFFNCEALVSITIPNSVTSIDDSAFERCTSLTSITIPNSVTSIGDSAFFECTSLTSITIPNSVTSIGDYTFSHCEALAGITVPNGVTSIGDYTFSGCKSFTSFSIPAGVTSIGDKAFSFCNSLVSITIPDSVTSIGNSAFSYCKALAGITIPDSVTSIGDSAFYFCDSLVSITIPAGVTSIGDSAFSYCKALAGITIPDSVTSIGDKTFSFCNSLVDITIPDGVTSIGKEAFRDCTALTNLTIPNSVESIGDYAFYKCTYLTSATFSGTKAEWNAIEKSLKWYSDSLTITIHCTDGDVIED